MTRPVDDQAHARSGVDGVQHDLQENQKQGGSPEPGDVASPPATDVPPITTTAIEARR